MTELQMSMCAVNGAEDCADGSIGKFMNIGQDTLEGVFDSAVGFLGSVSGLGEPLLWIAGNMTDLRAAFDDTEAAVLAVQPIVDDINTIAGDASYTRYSLSLDLPQVDASVTQTLSDTSDTIEESATATDEAYDLVFELAISPESELMKLSRTLDRIEGNEPSGQSDLRGSSIGAITKLLDILQKYTREIFKVQTVDVPKIHDGSQQFVEPVATATGAIVFFPAIFSLLFILLACLCRSSKPFYCHMFTTFIIQGFYCLLAGLFLVSIKIVGDICEVDEQFTMNYLDQPLKYNGEVATTTIGEAIVDVVNCQGVFPDEPTADNNLVDIFGAGAFLDLSDVLEPAAEAITDQRGLILGQKDQVETARAPLTSVDPYAVDLASDYDNTSLHQTLDDKAAALPPSPFDRDDRAQQDLFEAEYLPDGGGLKWNDVSTPDLVYADMLSDINAKMAAIDTAGGGNLFGSGADGGVWDAFTATNTFTTIQNFGVAEFCPLTGPDSVFKPDAVDGTKSGLFPAVTLYTVADSSEYNALCTALTAMDAETARIDGFVTLNDAFVADLAVLKTRVDDVGTALDVVGVEQARMGGIITSMLASLDIMENRIDSLVSQMDGVAAQVLGINDYVASGNRYTMCGFVGDVYESVYEGEFCTDLPATLTGVAGALCAVIAMLVVGFFVNGCYGPSMRSRDKVYIAGQETGDKLAKEGDAQKAVVLNNEY
ncbi:unnamed protein product [Chrysoparadoxa australica]